MSGLNLTRALFYTPEEVGELFRRDKQWAYKVASGFLAPSVRRFGRKQTLFLRAEVDRIALEGVPVDRSRYRKPLDVKTAKRYGANVPERPGAEDSATGGATDA